MCSGQAGLNLEESLQIVHAALRHFDTMVIRLVHLVHIGIELVAQLNERAHQEKPTLFLEFFRLEEHLVVALEAHHERTEQVRILALVHRV